MISAIFTFLTTNVPLFLAMLGGFFEDAVGLIYSDAALTDLGELVLLGAIVGLGYFVLRWILSLIPFARGQKMLRAVIDTYRLSLLGERKIIL